MFLKVGSAIFVFFVAIVCDYGVKQFFLSQNLACNSGISFGFFDSYGFLLTGMGFLLSLFFLWWGRKNSVWFFVGAGLFFAGAFLNISDRISYGCIRDFFYFFGWFVFNSADVFLMVGAILMGISMLGEKVKR